MKHYLTMLVGIVMSMLTVSLNGQYLITPVAPPPNFTFNDLWHFTVTRSNPDSYTQFYVTLRIFDGNSNLKVKSNSAVLSFPVGSQYYNVSNLTALQPFTTSFYDASLLQQAIATGGMFPPGSYNFVYTLLGKTADGEFIPLSEDASQATVETLWPPMLLSPPDGDTIDTQYPLLTWTPAFSSVISVPITYTLKMVEVQSGQNGYQAIQANPVHFTQNGLPTTLLPYPPSAQPLDTTKTYAWQVHADAMGTSLGSSEVWTFRFPKRRVKDSIPENKIYFDIKKQAPFEKYTITDGYLYIRYDEEYITDANAIRYSVMDKNYTVKNIPNLSVEFKKGVNRIKISQCLLNLGSFKKGEYFYFTITNPKGEKFVLKFFPLPDFNCQ